MCQQPSPTCDYKYRGLTQEEKKYIVDRHNELRQKVAIGGEKRRNQPSATNMQVMQWDDELAQIAQKHAERCKFYHDCRKCREVDRFPVGQNLYLRSSSRENEDFTWDKVIQGWYDEVAILPSKQVDSFSSVDGTQHYTQMVWWDTYKVGCGYVYYKERLWRKYYVCNYGPSGNWLDEPIYNRGKPCSSCPAGTKCSKKYSALCE